MENGVNLNKLIIYLVEDTVGTQNYIELNDSLSHWRYSSASWKPSDDVKVGKGCSSHVCAASLMSKERRAQGWDKDAIGNLIPSPHRVDNLLHLVRRPRQDGTTMLDQILKMNEGKFIRVHDKAIMIEHISKWPINLFGRFVISLRSPHEHKMWGSYDKFIEWGYSPELSVHLAHVFKYNENSDSWGQYSSTHQAFSLMGNETNYAKLVDFVVSGKNWYDHTDPGKEDGTWSLSPFDMKTFGGGTQLFGNLHTDEVKNGWSSYKAVPSKVFKEALDKEIQVATLKHKIKKALG